jgi:hypothetical protein
VPQSGRHLDRGRLTAGAHIAHIELAPRCRALSLCARQGTCPDDARRRALGREPSALPPTRLRSGVARSARTSSRFTLSNSPLRDLRRAAPLVPAAHFLRPGCHFLLSPPHLRCLCRRFGGPAPETLASAVAPTPNRGVGGAPGGALP